MAPLTTATPALSLGKALAASVLLAAAPESPAALPPAQPPEHPFLTFERPRDYVVDAR
ncbi:MAG: hypothetical protein AAF368_20660 [Planctomycetota bacterium]